MVIVQISAKMEKNLFLYLLLVINIFMIYYCFICYLNFTNEKASIIIAGT